MLPAGAFTEADAIRLLALAKTERATLLTTEKDHARLTGLSGIRADLRIASRALPIRLQLDAESERTLRGLLQSCAPLLR